MASSESPETSLSGYDILVNARTLIPELRERGDEIDELRRLPDDLVDTLKAAGCYRMAMPKDWGGPEMSSIEQHEAIFELSRGNGSVGWCVMIGLDAGIFAGYLDDDVARALYPRLDMIQAGWLYPMGRADKVDGGYNVSGFWRFASGSAHCDVLDAGCTLFEDGEPLLGPDGMPRWRVMLAPRERFEILDVWHTTGLRGTGSNDYRVEDLFVPEQHTFSFADRPKRDGPTWIKPDAVLRKMSAIPLGIARDALDVVTALMRTKVERPSGRPYRDSARVRIALAEGEMRFGAADGYVRRSLERQWECLERGMTQLPERVRVDAWVSRTFAFQESRRIVADLYDLVGGAAVYARECPLDRHLRDVQTACQHMVGQLKSMESVGELLLDPDARIATPML
jgi:alkylation response protein AidB-like acyl-CoA dehydrogenase